MTRLLTPAVLLLILLLSIASSGAVFTVDDDGVADFATIQEAADAASLGDTILVYPGTYTGAHPCEYYDDPVCVCLSSEVVLVSAAGPAVTFIDVVDPTRTGVGTQFVPPVVVEGFTFLRNSGAGDGSGVAVSLENGAVRGNVIAGFGGAVTTWPPWLDYRGHGRPGSREEVLITENALTGNGTGIRLFLWGASTVSVTGNTITDNTGSGVSARGVGDLSLVGNEISGNGRGVSISNPSHTVGVQFDIELLGNTIRDSDMDNISVSFAEIDTGSVCNLTIGGTLENGNDIYGPGWHNLRAESDNVALFIDATYNYWGSTACSVIVPLFDIRDSNAPMTFDFEPFVDATHTVEHDCQAAPTERSSWGVIKSLYR